MPDHIRQFRALGGKFDAKTNEGVINGINLKTMNIETLCDALKKGFNILSLTFEGCSLNEYNLDGLFDVIINRSSIRRLFMSNTTIKFRELLVRKSECIGGCVSVLINNKSLNIHFFQSFQHGDIDFIGRIWSQNKICRVLNISGGNLIEQEKHFSSYFKNIQEPIVLTIKYSNNIEFLCDLIKGKFFIQDLKLSFWSSPSTTLSHFCEALAKNSTLTELSIIVHHCFDNDDFIDQLLTTLRGHKSIKRLILHVHHVLPSNRKESCLIKALTNYSFITCLYISESIVSKNFAEALIVASQRSNSLTHLQFYDCQISDDHISSLQLLLAAENLKHLSFSKEQYWIITITKMRQQLEEENIHYQNQKLERLIQHEEKDQSKILLYRQELTDRDMEIIINKGIHYKQCQQLYLGSNKFTSIGISILADALNSNQILEDLSFYDNQVCDNGVYFLAKVLSIHNQTLKKLDLGKCQITDEGLKHLAQMIKTNRTLIHLYLNHNQITDHGIQILADAIENHNKTIETLYLFENKSLTDGCVDYLISMIKRNQSLKLIRLYDCSLSGKGKEKLNTSQKSKKNLEIWTNNLFK